MEEMYKSFILYIKMCSSIKWVGQYGLGICRSVRLFHLHTMLMMCVWIDFERGTLCVEQLITRCSLNCTFFNFPLFTQSESEYPLCELHISKTFSGSISYSARTSRLLAP